MPSLDSLVQSIITGSSVGGVYALIALAFGIVWRTTRVFNFAQGDFGTLGGYITHSLYVSGGWPILPAIAVACAAVGSMSVAVERVALRPLYKRGVIYPIISTAGLAFAIQSAVRLEWGSIPTTFPSILGDQPFSVLGVRLIPQVLWVFVITLGLAAIAAYFLERTKMGTAMRSCSQDQEVSQLLGIDVSRTFMWAFLIAGVLGAISGILVAPITTLRPGMGLTLGLYGMVAALVGGFGSVRGAIIGGVIVGITQSTSVLFFDPTYRDVTAFALLVLIVLVRPWGLFGDEGARVRRV